MANYVKYSTSAQTKALKMGNFWLGVENDGKGPTSTTGYYTALAPPSGGFTVYSNKASNGPAIYQATNESQLVAITNQLGSQSFTTSAQCLTWYVTQTDKFCVNRDYENIVTNGLVLNIDAGFTPSYPTSGTSWYDLGPSGNTGTLTNGPTFNSANGGSIVFDGVDDYANGNLPLINTPLTFEIFGKFTNTTQINYEYFGMLGNDSDGPSSCISISKIGTLFGNPTYNGNMYIWAANTTPTLTDINLSTTNWQHIVVVTTSTPPYALVYKNGVQGNILSGIPNTSQIPQAINITTGVYTIGRYPTNNSWLLNGNIGIYRVYNRALTSNEILQNYNAQKGRFGL